MSKLRVTIIDEVKNRRLKVDLPDDATVEKLLPALANKLGLPPAAYQLTHEVTGRALGGGQALASFGVREGDALRLTAEKAIPLWQKVPVWAWAAIGGVVLLIVVGGAFLAGRGGEASAGADGGSGGQNSGCDWGSNSHLCATDGHAYAADGHARADKYTPAHCHADSAALYPTVAHGYARATDGHAHSADGDAQAIRFH